MNKVKDIIIWVVILAYLFIALGFTSERRATIPCSDVELIADDTLNNTFINRQDVLSIINRDYRQIIGYPIDSVDVARLENILNRQPAIKQAQIYKTIKGKIEVELIQRKPIVRIFDTKNRGFYIDNEGVIIPPTNKYAAHVLVANGNIPVLTDTITSVVNLVKHSETFIWNDIFELSKIIYYDTFWKAQIQQIYINSQGEIELIPRVGAHIIIFGKFDNHDKKLWKLKAMYQNALSHTGWDKYKTINLKYGNQVVCTKR